jgi:hypothetical protein
MASSAVKVNNALSGIVVNSAVVTAAGNTALWTPTNGTRFLLRKAIISVSATAASLTPVLIQLMDANVLIAQYFATVGVTLGLDSQIPPQDFGLYFSSALNNVLNVNLSVALLTGGVAVTVFGFETL